MAILRRFSGFVDGLNDRIGIAVRWLALIMVIIGAASALMRYIARWIGMSMNLTPLVEGQWYAFSVIFLLGAAYGLNRDVHVRVDVLYSRLSAKTRAWIDTVGSVIFLIPFCLLMLWVSWPPVKSSWSIREMSPDPGGLPRYPIKALILLSFLMLVIQGVSQVIKNVDVIMGAATPAPSGHRQEGGHV